MLVEIDVWNHAHLWYRENDRVVHRRDDFIPELLVSGENNVLEEIESLDMDGVVNVRRKIFRTVEGEYEGVGISVRPYNFFNVAYTIDRYFNYHRARLYNVDIRFSVRYMADKGIFPFYDGRDRFIPMDSSGLRVIEFKRLGNTLIYDNMNFDILDYRRLQKIMEDVDPDVVILPGADVSVRKMVEISRKRNDEFCLGRRKGWRVVGEREYFSYGREYYRTGAYIPVGRALIDPDTSFVYREGGLNGILTVSRISGIPVSLAARSTPGTLVSTMEVYEALKRGIAVPYHKYVAEKEKTLEKLVIADRGGIVYQPRPGLYFCVTEIDFTSMYPSIIVRRNLSIETLNRECAEMETVPEIGYTVCKTRGFLPAALEPLLELRIKTKKMKKFDSALSGIDSSLKWMLVTSFGYTGYRNAKFGSIEVHEAINAYAREYFLRAKEILEKSGCSVIHGIVDSVFVQGKVDEGVVLMIENETSLPVEISERYLWVKIIPEKGMPVVGAPAKYIGLKEDGDFKVRGIMMRRQDSPEFIKRFQNESLGILRELKSMEDMGRIKERLSAKFMDYKGALERRGVRKEDLLIEKRVSRYPFQYESRTVGSSILWDMYERGELKRPGENIRYLVYSTNPLRAVDEKRMENVDYSLQYYISLLREAYMEIIPQ